MSENKLTLGGHNLHNTLEEFRQSPRDEMDGPPAYRDTVREAALKLIPKGKGRENLRFLEVPTGPLYFDEVTADDGIPEFQKVTLLDENGKVVTDTRDAVAALVTKRKEMKNPSCGYNLYDNQGNLYYKERFRFADEPQ